MLIYMQKTSYLCYTVQLYSLWAKCSMIEEKNLSTIKIFYKSCLWKSWTPKLTISFNPFLQWFPKFVKRKNLILLFRLLKGLSDLIRFLCHKITLYSYQDAICQTIHVLGKPIKWSIVCNAMLLATGPTKLIFYMWSWTTLLFQRAEQKCS